MRGHLKHEPQPAAPQSPPSSDEDAALAAFGLARADADGPGAAAAALPEFWLWPECEPAFVLWAAVQTQWRAGLQGYTGLDYAGVRAHPAFVAIRGRGRRERLLADVHTLERALLREWAEQRARRRLIG